MNGEKVINKALNSIVNDANGKGDSMGKDNKSGHEALHSNPKMQEATLSAREEKGIEQVCASAKTMRIESFDFLTKVAAEKVKAAEPGAAAGPTPENPQAD